MEELDENLSDVSSDGDPRSPPSQVRFRELNGFARWYDRPFRRCILREIIDDRKGHLLILVQDRLLNCFRCNRGSKGTIPIFLCRICELSLHVNCALPLVATSKHHRHPLSFADSYVEDDSGEYYCDNCETRRNPRLPVYRCLEGNCRFVAHFNCVFSECQLSIAHKCDDKTSTLLISNPVLTAVESLKSIAKEGATKLDAIVRALISGKLLAVMEVPQLDDSDSGCNTQNGAAYEEFMIFMARYISTPRDTISEQKSVNANLQVANVGNDRISNLFASFLKARFRMLVDSHVDSKLCPRTERALFMALCKAIYDMYYTKDPNITEDLLFTWWDYFRIADLVRYKVQFAFDMFIEDLHCYLGFSGSSSKDCGITKVDNNTERSLEVEAAEEKHTCRVVTVVANRGGERLSETLELVEEVEYMADNSWNEYDNLNLDDDCALSEDEINFNEDYVNEKWIALRVELQKHTNESSLSEEPLRGIITLEGKEKIEFIQECRIVKQKIEAFIVQNLPIRSLSSCAHKHRMTIYDEKNTGGVPCSGCKLPILESPFYGCTLCKFFLHGTCAELPQRIRCILHDHDLNLRQLGSSLHLSGEDVSDEICCFMCNLPIWGSTYHCTECKLYLHKLCVRLPLEIQHSLHPRHLLYLDLDRETDRTCNACGQQWRGCAYTCERCKFYLEVCCIYLKPTIRSIDQSLEHLLTLVEERSISRERACYECGENLHEHGPFLYCMQWRISFHVQCSLPSTNTSSTHRHSLTLTDSYVEDCSPELYCDNCEKERHPNHPIYLCRECGYVAHISCENYEMC